MTTAQRDFIKIQKRQSELRGEFNTLRTTETRSAEQDTRLTALDGELTATETEFQAASDALLTEQTTTTAPGGEDTEARERRELCERANVGDVYGALIEKRQTDGATAEAQAAHGCAPNQIPLAMLRTEVRAVTPTPGASQTEQAETVQPVFATGAGAFLGIDRPTVAMGQAVYPVLTSRPTVRGPHADSTDAGDTTGAFDADLLPPKRIQASFIYRRTDAMQFGSMDSALRMALNGGLQEKLDYEAIGGTDAGLLVGTNLPDHDVSAVTSFANYLSRFLYGRVDGRYAEMKSDIRVLMGAPIYAHAGSVYQSSAYKSALSVLEQDSGGVRVSAHVPAVVSKKQDSVIRLGMRRDMVQPVWGAVTIIVDEVTLSGKGEIEVSAVLGMNTKILRQDGFYKQQSQHP